MIKSIIDSDPETSESLVLGIPFGAGVSFGTGTENGPAAIKEILDSQVELFDRYTKRETCYEHTIGYEEVKVTPEVDAKSMCAAVTDQLAGREQFVLGLGGTHIVTLPILEHYATRHDPQAVTVVQLDAHLDLRNDDSEYSDETPDTLAHSTVMRRVHELGYNILPVGIRTYAKEEYEYAFNNEIDFVEASRFDKPVPAMEEIVNRITTDAVYITCDIDALDPGIAPGTGTPVPGGLTIEFVEHLIHRIAQRKTIIGADIVEVAPLANNPITEYTAGQIAYHILSQTL